jgi:hypothetical protein
LRSFAVSKKWQTDMRLSLIAGIVLVIVGVICLAYQGITYTSHKKVLQVGPIQATKTEHRTIPLPPIVGGVLVVGGIVLISVGGRTKS